MLGPIRVLRSRTSRSRVIRPAATVALGLVVGLVATAALAACASASHEAGADNAVTVSVSVSDCGAGWTSDAAHAGHQRFVLHNVDSRSGEVYLQDAASGAVYAEVEPLAPEASTTVDADLGAGRYRFRCLMEDEPAVNGPTVTVPGAANSTAADAAVRPVDEADLVPATLAYQRYVQTRLPGLGAAAATLHADLARGDLAAARRDWLPAQLDYTRLGAAYDAFGDLDADLDSRADGLPGGVRDASWRGLHRIEYGLWHGQSAATLAPLAAELVTDVRHLERQFPHADVQPLDISIRAHEISEDALGFALTGRDDYGAHAGLAVVDTDVAATRDVLGFVRSLLAPRYRDVAALDAQLDRTQHDIESLRHDGRYPAPDALTRPQRERVNSDVSALTERLAPVAAILEPRRTS